MGRDLLSLRAAGVLLLGPTERLLADGRQRVFVNVFAVGLLDLASYLLRGPLQMSHGVGGHLHRGSGGHRQRGRHEVGLDVGEEDEANETTANDSHREQQRGDADGRGEGSASAVRGRAPACRNDR